MPGRLRMVVALAAVLALAVGPGSASSSPTELFFSEYIEGTSNNKALEIFNGTGAAVNLTALGYNVQMFFNGSSSAGLTINLTGSVADGDVFVLGHSSATSPVIIAQADQTNGAGWFNGNDAVVLRRGTTVVDVIGQVGFDPGAEWGTGVTSTQDNTLRRKAAIEAGDTNGADTFDPSIQWDGFATDTFGGLGSHSLTTGGDAAPAVAHTTPSSGAVDVPLGSNVTITFTEPVNTTGSWFDITCSDSGNHAATASGGPTTFTLDPSSDFAVNESCTVTVFAAGVSDQDVDDPPDAMTANHGFSFTTVGAPARIRDIQGAAHLSPLAGDRVSAVPGIVTALRLAPASARGFYVQDSSPDTNDATSEGIFVFTGSIPTVAVGDAVSVNGTVTEFRPGSDPDNLTITELIAPNITVGSSGNPLPVATIIGAGGRPAPTEVIDDDPAPNVETGGTFDQATDGIDFYESLESMLVQVNAAAVVGATRSFGEITVLPDGGSWATGLRTPRGGILYSYADPNPERVIVDDEILRDQIFPRPSPKAMPDMNVGDDVTTPIVGPLDYSFSNYKIQATTMPTFVSGGLQREVAALPDKSKELAIATFNVENLTPGNPPAKFADLAELIVDNLRSPDILALEEVQDNNGTTNNGVTDASQTYAMLIAAIESAGGPTYAYRQIDPVNNADGGQPGGNIRVALLFRTDVKHLSFVDRPGGSSTSDTQVVGKKNDPQLSASPGRLGTSSPAFVDTRKPLVGEFKVHGRTLFVVVNHFSSKGDDQPLFGPNQPPTRFTEVARHGQADVVHDFVADVLALDKKANVVVLGDINDFEFSETVDILTAGGVLTTLIDTLPPNERYSYVFEGNSQVLDQILVSDAILSRKPAYDVVHVNSEFADAIQASDHEPSVAHVRAH